MNYLSLLILIFIIATIFQLGFVLQNSWKSLLATKYYIANYSDRSNRVSIVISTLLLALPLTLFNHYKTLTFTNNLSDTIFLIILSVITIFLILLDKKVFWSEKFRKPTIYRKNSNTEIHKLEKEVNIKFLKNENITSNLKRDVDKKFVVCEKKISENRNEIASTAKNLIVTKKCLKKVEFKMNNQFEVINENDIDKIKCSVNKRNKAFKDYFIDEETYQNFEELITKNGFYQNKHKHTATYLSILTAKLLDLGAININRKQEHFSIAIAKNFKIAEFHTSTLSNVLNDFKKKSFDHKHKEFYDHLFYLDTLS